MAIEVPVTSAQEDDEKKESGRFVSSAKKIQPARQEEKASGRFVESAKKVKELDNSLQSSLYGAAGNNPDHDAEILKNARYLGVPYEVAERQAKRLEKDLGLKKNNPQKIKQQTPRTAQILSNPPVAKIAHDDVENMGTMEKLIWWADEAIEKSQRQIEANELNYKSMTGELTARESRRLDYLENFKNPELGDDGWFERSYTGAFELGTQFFEMGVAGLKGGGAGAATGAAIGGAGGLVLGPFAGVTAVGGAKIGFGVGARAGVLYHNFEQLSGEAYSEIKNFTDVEGNKIDPGVARVASLAAGLVNAGLDTAGAGFLLKQAGGDVIMDKLGKKGIQEALKNPTVLKSLQELSLRYSKGMGFETFTEVAQEAVKILAGELAMEASPQEFKQEGKEVSQRAREAWFRLSETELETVKQLTLFSGIGPTGKFAYDRVQVHRANKNKDRIEKILKNAKESKVRKRDRETFKENVKQQAEGSDVETIYMQPEDVRELYQSDKFTEEDRTTVEKAIPDLEQRIDEAERLGQDVEIPLEEYVDAFADTEVGAVVNEYIAFHPADWTNHDAKKQIESMGERLIQEIKTAEQEGNPVTDFDLETIRTLVVDGLVREGTHKSVAEAQVVPLVNFFKTMAQRTGQTPLSIYENLSVQVGETGFNEQSDSDFSFDQPLDEDSIMAELEALSRKIEQEGLSDAETRGIEPDTDARPDQQTDQRRDGEQTDQRGEQPAARSETVGSQRGRPERGISEQLVRGTDGKSSSTLRSVTGKPPREGWAENTRVRTKQGGPLRVFRSAAWSLVPKDFKFESLGKGSGYPLSGMGVFSSTNREDSLGYMPPGGVIEEFYLDIRNPKVYKFDEMPDPHSLEEAWALSRELEQQGYDGIVMDARSVGGPMHFIAFRPEQFIPASTEGQVKSYFQFRRDEARGRITFSGNKAIINLFENKNLTTFMHETGHFFLESFMRIAKDSDNIQIQSDLAAIQAWFRENAADIAAWVNENTDSTVTAEDVNAEIDKGNFADGDIATGMHEYWARGFEAYLMTGKSPSLDMASLFSRFRQWMIDTYKTLRKLNVNLSKEVSGVMDRMIATDEEIVQAERIARFTELKDEVLRAGVTEAEWNKYLQDVAAATEADRQRLFRQAQKDAERSNTNWWNQAKKRITKQVNEEFDQMPVWNVIELLTTGKIENGDLVPEGFLGQKLDKSILVDFFGADYVASLPKGLYQNTGGIPVDLLSDFYGFNSPQEMLEEIKAALKAKIPPEQERIKARADAVREGLKRVRTTHWNRPETLVKYVGYKPTSIQSYIKSRGGLFLSDTVSGELKARDLKMPGLVTVNYNGRNGIDDIALYVAEGNLYFVPTEQDGRISHDELYDALDESIRDENIYEMDAMEKLNAYFKDAEEAAYLEELGVTEDTADIDIINAIDQGIPVPEGSKKEKVKTQRNRKQAVEDEVNERLEQEYGKEMTEGSMAVEAMDAVFSHERGKVIEAELKMLLKHTSDDRKRSARRDRNSLARVRKVDKSINRTTAKKVAAYLVGKTKLIDLKPHQYQAMATRFAKKAEEAIAVRDFDSAAFYKQSQLLNHYRYIESKKALERAEQMRKYFKTFTSKAVRSKLGTEYMDQIDSLLENFEFKRVSQKELERRKSLKAFVDDQTAQGKELLIPNEYYDMADTVNYREQTMDQLFALRDAVKTIEQAGKLKNHLINQKRKRDIEAQGRAVAETIRKNMKDVKTGTRFRGGFAPQEVWSNLRGFGRGINAQLLRPEFLFKMLDGWKDNGVVWKAFFEPFVKAENAELELKEPMIAKFNEIFGKYSIKDGFFTKRIFIPEINDSLTRAHMVMVALNAGNAGNRQALLDSEKWSEIQLQAVLDKLSENKQDLDTVQDVFDLIESLWPKIVQHEKEMTGIIPEKVEATPIITQNGRIEGGYFPLVADPRDSMKGIAIAEKENAMYGLNNLLKTTGNFVSASTRRGHTINRTGWGEAKLLFDISVISSHIDNVAHDLTHRKAIYDVNALLDNKDVQQAFEEKVGKAYLQQLKPWLHAIARDENRPMGYVEQLVGRVRAGVSVTSMGLKATTTLVQFLGYSNTIHFLGPKYATIGLRQFTMGGERPGQQMFRMKEYVMEKSTMMKFRQHNFDRDLREAARNAKGNLFNSPRMQAAYFSTIGYMDMAVSIPTWLGAYEKGMDQFNGNESEAIAFADSAVRMTQSVGAVKDLAAVQRGGEFQRAFTMFYTYFSALYGQYARAGGLINSETNNFKKFVETMSAVTLLWFVPAVLSEMLTRRVPEDDEEAMKHLVASSISYAFAPIPVVRDMVSAAIHEKYGYKLSPVTTGIGAMVDATGSVGDVVDGEWDRNDIKNINKALGVTFKYPSDQLFISAEAFYDWAIEGEELTPMDFLMKDVDRR